MSSHSLPSEVISLIHHIELNKHGWWRKAIGQIILGVLWKSDSALTVPRIRDAIAAEIHHSIGEDRIHDVCNTLNSQNSLIKLGETYKLTEHARQTLESEHHDYEQERDACEKSFKASCLKNCPELNSEDVWNSFKIALVKCVKTTGANLYHLITDGHLKKDFDWPSYFLSAFNKKFHDGLNEVINDFFANKRACRKQLLRLLSAYFVTEASQLTKETLQLIEQREGTQHIKVVLDTNFIFSILDLHDNPGNEPASSLMGLIKKQQSNFQLKLYVLPSTVEEVKKVLSTQKEKIERIRATSSSLIHAAQRQALTSVIKKYYEQAANNLELTPETFFSPYINDLETILKSKNINILDTNHKIYSMKQNVIDDTLSEQEREIENIKDEKKRKSYEILLHDMILWHAVHDRRPGYTKSTFDVEYWAVTIDWRLIHFDRKKISDGYTKYPVVLHPSNLIQFIQFWIPRDEQIDDILIDSLHSPTHFSTFEPDDEAATLKILESISRYENSNDISEEMAEKILSNEAIRLQFKNNKDSKDSAYFQDLIEGTIIEEYNEAKKREEKAIAEKNSSQESLTKLEIEAQNQIARATSSELELYKKKYAEIFVWLPLFIGTTALFSALHYSEIIEKHILLTEAGIYLFYTSLLIAPILAAYPLANLCWKKIHIVSEWRLLKVHKSMCWLFSIPFYVLLEHLVILGIDKLTVG